jgi:uncharacterized protein YjbI with pentapeptide repeats
MANDEQLALLKKGVAAWNAWRDENRATRPDLSRTYLRGENLDQADLGGADLSGAYLGGANLSGAILNGADLTRADLSGADLSWADLRGARLPDVNLSGANLSRANLSGADLGGADLNQAELNWANLSGVNLSGAALHEVRLRQADLREANLRGANLRSATLVSADLSGADLTGCLIHGVSAWDLKLDKTSQQNLVITHGDDPAITVDDIEVAQFIYLMLNNQKVRGVIDTITSKVVLILGRFTDERKAVLNALREELRKRDRLPILFDFEAPARQNLTETITLLARMARFIIADLTDPSSIPQELQTIIPSVRVPIQPLLLEGSSLYSMFKDFEDYPWVLPVYQYKKPEQLLATLGDVIAPAEGKAKALADALAKRRREIEAELAKPRPQ